jgi:hypothetical protein
MTVELDLVDKVAAILSIHGSELAHNDTFQELELNPKQQTAVLIWRRLADHFEDFPALRESLLILVITPNETTRDAVVKELLLLFGSVPGLASRIQEIVSHSPYAALSGTVRKTASTNLSPLSRTVRSNFRKPLILLLVVSLMLRLIEAGEYQLWITIGFLVVQGVVVAYCAKGLKVRRPFWLGIGAVFPYNLALITLAVYGYRLVFNSQGKEVARYTPTTKAITAVIVGAPVIMFAVLSIINPEYMSLLYTEIEGNYILAAAMLAFALLLLSIGLGFWLDRARTGIGIAIAATVAGWAFTFLAFFVLLGPAVVRVMQICPQGIRCLFDPNLMLDHRMYMSDL